MPLPDDLKRKVKRPLESDRLSEVLRFFQIRKKWDNDEYIIPITADLEFLVEGRRRFQGEVFERLFRSWCSGELNEGKLRSELARFMPDRRVYFDTYLVNRRPLSTNTGPEEDDECAESLRHPFVHRAVHAQSDPNSNGA